ncbi:MAG TPA: hypothetical protein VN132_00180 [Bdellovibrio sp.]|nr:hypothetical protein [Bdellovibrio sp.]
MELVNTSIIPPEFRNSVNTFLSFLNPEATVLVIGAGDTDLLNKFKFNGFHVICIEQDPELCRKWRLQGVDMIQGTFKDLATIKAPNNLQGIWGGSAFEHMPLDQFEHNLEIIHLMLPNHGAFFLRVLKGEEVTTTDQTHFYSENELQRTLRDIHFDIKLLESSTPSTLTAVATRESN